MKTKFNGILTLLLALVVQISFAQDRTISGTVSDESGPLPGVTVLKKGTKQGTETDFDGKYTIKVQTGSVLVYSFVGMKTTEKTVDSSNNINITMKEDKNLLEEVVIQGALGVERIAKSVGYAQQKLSGDELSTVVEANLVNSLSGKVSGIQITNSSGNVGSSARVVLRGPNSITGNNQPLYVVDGIPVSNGNVGTANGNGGVDLPGGVSDINPDDIEAISVLKGPNAAALYGIRASNGAIVITTKKGKLNTGLGVQYTSSITFSNPLVLPRYQNSYGQGSNPTHFEFVDGANGVGDGVDESWGAPLDVGLSFVQFNSFINGNNGQPLPWVSHPDNVKDFFNTGSIITNNITLSGGSENVTYRVSGGLFDQEGIIPNTNFSKRNVGASVNWVASKKLNVGLNATLSRATSDNIASGGYSANNQIQQLVWSARNVDINALKDYKNLPLSANGTPLNWNTAFQNNPFWALANNTNPYSRNRLIGAANVGYAVTDDLKFNTKVSIDQYDQVSSRRSAKGSNESLQGSFGLTNRTYREVNYEALASYNKDINDKFKFGVNLGANKLTRSSTLDIFRAPALQIDKLWTIDNLASGSTLETTGAFVDADISKQAINSIYGFGSIAYNDYLFLEFTARNDWASVLPKKNNSFFYPSVNLSAVVSDMVDLGKTIDYLKVRGGWAEVGSVGALGSYSISPVYNLAQVGTITTAGISGTLWNPNLKPETTTSTEIGFETRLLNNRVSLDFTYYDTKSEDLLISGDVSRASGFNRAWNNLASMTNKGIEIQLSTTPVKTDNFKLDVDFNFGKNTNEVTEIKGIDALQLTSYWSAFLRAREGSPYGTLEGRKFQRNSEGQVEINQKTGLPIVSGKNEILGDVQPDWTGGVKVTAAYKGFTLSALVDAKIGGEVYSMTHAWGRFSGILEESLQGRETGLVIDGVFEGTNTQNNIVVSAKDYAHSAFGNNVEESSVFDASYVKLRELSLSYKIPKEWIKKSGVDDVRLSLVGRNLAILHKNAPHIDPETAFSSGNGGQGMEFAQIPSVSSYGLSLSIKF